MTEIKQRAMFWLIIGPVLVLAVFPTPWLISQGLELFARERLEAQRVVIDWHAEHWTNHGHIVEADIYGTKQRLAHYIEDQRVTAIAKVGGEMREVEVTFLRDTSPGSTRPRGQQFFGRWQFIAPAGMSFEAGPITAIIAHDIDGHLIITEAGPFYFQK